MVCSSHSDQLAWETEASLPREPGFVPRAQEAWKDFKQETTG